MLLVSMFRKLFFTSEDSFHVHALKNVLVCSLVSLFMYSGLVTLFQICLPWSRYCNLYSYFCLPFTSILFFKEGFVLLFICEYNSVLFPVMSPLVIPILT